MKEQRNKYIQLTTITSICTKRYVTKALIVAMSPTISTGRIPEVTAQNVPKNENKFHSLNRIKDYVPLMIIEIQGVSVRELTLAKIDGSKPSRAIA